MLSFKISTCKLQSANNLLRAFALAVRGQYTAYTERFLRIYKCKVRNPRNPRNPNTFNSSLGEIEYFKNYYHTSFINGIELVQTIVDLVMSNKFTIFTNLLKFSTNLLMFKIIINNFYISDIILLDY